MISSARRSLTLGSLHLQSLACLAPLESVSDCGFRNLCYKNGAAITWTEMVRASALGKMNESTLSLIDCYDPNTCTGVQLMAKNVNELRRALGAIEQLSQTSHPHFNNLVAIDLNFGCPSPSIINIGCGPALLRRRTRLTALFACLVNFKRTSRILKIGAVGAKIRLGMSEKEMSTDQVYLGAVEAGLECGLDFITVHGRHAKMTSSDLPNWSAIKECVELRNTWSEANLIPLQNRTKIIGNGNVFDFTTGSKMIKETGVDAVMLARGAMANPFSFQDFRIREECMDINLPSSSFSELDTESKIDYILTARTKYTKISTDTGSKPKCIEKVHQMFARMIDNLQSGRGVGERLLVPWNEHGA